MTPRLLAVLLLSGCAKLGDDIPDEPITSARLQNLDTNSAVVIVGPVGGDALLVFDTEGGETLGVPVSVSGGALGAVLAISVDLNPGSDVELDLTEADEGVTARDLLGTYSGGDWNLTIGVGGSGRRLKNGHGVAIHDEHWTAGVGIEAGFEWLRIREGGQEGVDTGFDPPDTEAPIDTADSDDTDRDTEDTGPQDTGDPPSNGGSGCDGGGGGCHAEQTNTGCDCDSGDACGCTTGVPLGTPMLISFVIALTRRRNPARAE